uniref:separase n=1 Tax=Ascaris suum TaxID=6253 RepID=F1KSK0_ASCSU
MKEDSDGSGTKFIKAKQYLGYLLQKHLLLSGNIQEEMFDAVKKEEDGGFHFFDTSQFNGHISLSRVFTSSLNKSRAHHYLQLAYTFWSEQFAPAILALNNEQERTVFAQLPKLLAAYLLIAGEYSKVVVCLAHAVRLNNLDATCRILLLRWLCHLGEWQMTSEQLKIDAKLPTICGTHYEILINIIANIVDLNTQPNKEEIVERLVTQWQLLSEVGSKTFMLYQCQAIVKHALIVASRLPRADLTKIGDPLKNSEMEIARLTALVKNRHQSFYNYAEGIDMQKKVVNPDEFLKLCSHIAEHFEATILQCHELAVTGILRECEGIIMSLWRQSLRLGSLPRTIVVVNFLMMLVLMSNYMRNREQTLRFVYAAILNVPKQSEDGEHLIERSSHSSLPTKESSLASLMLHAFCHGKESGDCEKKKERTEEARLEPHSGKCSCAVCEISSHNLEFQLNVSFAAFLFSGFSSHSFQSMALKFRNLSSSFSEQHARLCNAVGANIEAKDFYPLSARNLFLTAAVRWLLKNGAEEKPQIKEKVVHESLKICEHEPWNHRWQWLTIRQLERETTVDVSQQFPWILPSHPSCCIPLSSLADEFNALSLQTPRKAQLRKTPQSATTSSLLKSAREACVTKEGLTVRAICSSEALESAMHDFENFSHLFYREWRHLSCSSLARANSTDSWLSAYFFIEATCFATRQLARMADEEGESFRYENIEQFKAAVKALPSDITVVQLFLDASRVLWLIRLHCDRTPLIVPIVGISQDEDLLRRLQALLQENDLSGKMGATCKDAKKFWAIRRRLDSSMEVIIRDVETEWMREFACLLLPCFRLTEAGLSAASEITERGFSDGAAKVLVEMCSILPVSEWRRLAERFAVLDDMRRASSINTLCRLRSLWDSDREKGQELVDRTALSYTLFAVSPELASFPFEMMPILSKCHRVCRITSLYLFQRIFMRSKEIPKFVDGRNSFYLLDPGGDLTETQNRLAERLRMVECWKGLIGKSPDPKELKASLESSDFFFYMGHGSGGRYFGKATIRRTDCRAVSVLMGCSSARTTHEGEGLDGRNAIYDYSVARCPCAVGCLWMVTDGEIDRFFLAMISYCFSDEIDEARSKDDKNGPSYRLLIDALAYARTACKLRYMTGGAVVSYGLPIMSTNSHLLRRNICG